MTLVEFLQPLRRGTHQSRVLATLYFLGQYTGISEATVDQIRDSLKSARVSGSAKLNIADVLNKSGHYVEPTRKDAKKHLWRLTGSGRARVRELLSLPADNVEMGHDAGTLGAVVAALHDAEIKDYADEALKCLQAGALRATVVFLWAAAIREIQSRLFTHGSAVVTAALQKHDPKARSISRLDDFAYVRDETTLLAAKELGVLDKNEKDTLQEALGLRNRCGHPGKYRPGVKKVSGFIEDIISIIFT